MTWQLTSQNASTTNAIVANQSRFLIDNADSRTQVFTNISNPLINSYDLASWTAPAQSGNGTEVLIMAVNFNYGPNDAGPTWMPAFQLANYTGKVQQVLAGNVTMGDDGGPVFQLGRTSIAAVILSA